MREQINITIQASKDMKLPNGVEYLNYDGLVDFLDKNAFKEDYGYSLIPAEKDEIWSLNIIASTDGEIGKSVFVDNIGYFDVISFQQLITKLTDWKDYIFHNIALEEN